jgi:hypothetical protein
MFGVAMVKAFFLTGCLAWLPRHLLISLQIAPTSRADSPSPTLQHHTVNLFHRLPLLDNHTGVRGSQVWTIVCMDCTLPSLGFKPTPHTTRGLNWSVSQCYRALLPHWGALTQPHSKTRLLWIWQYPYASWCRHWSIAQTRVCGRQATYTSQLS